MKVIAILLFSVFCLATARAGFTSGSDTFATAAVIPSSTSQDSSNATLLDNKTAEAGEPDYTGTKRTAWWVWTAPASGWATFSTQDNPFTSDAHPNTELAVFTGTAVNNLSFVAGNSNGINTLHAKVTFYAVPGTSYRIQLDSGSAGSTGQAVLSMRFLPSVPFRILGSQLDSTSRPVQFSVSATAGGAVTARLVMNGRARTLTGVASVDGWFTALVAQPALPSGQPVAPLMFMMDLVPNEQRVHHGWLQDGSGSPKLLNGYQVKPFSAASPHPLSPRFTAMLIMSGAGEGYLTATISTSGVVTMAGRTGDGLPFTSSSALCVPRLNKPTQYQVPLSSAAGRFTGVVLFEEVMGGTDLVNSFDLTYRRLPPTTGVYYPNGLYAFVSASGAAYQAPASGQRAMGLLDGSSGNGKLTFLTAMGEYSGTTVGTFFSVANAFTFPGSPFKNTLTLNRATGVVTGTSLLTAGYSRTLRGVLTLDNGAPLIRGYVTGKTRTGSFKVTP